MKLLHAALLVFGLASASVKAQKILAPLWTDLNVDSPKCLKVENNDFSGGSPVVMLVNLL
jgi:hypothetical protein